MFSNNEKPFQLIIFLWIARLLNWVYKKLLYLWYMFYKMGKPQSHICFLKRFFKISSHFLKNSMLYIVNIVKIFWITFLNFFTTYSQQNWAKWISTKNKKDYFPVFSSKIFFFSTKKRESDVKIFTEINYDIYRVVWRYRSNHLTKFIHFNVFVE